MTSLHEIAELDRLLIGSDDAPLLIFKHSRTCGTSAEALDELLATPDIQTGRTRVVIVTVQTDRAVSNAVAARLGVRHETPQALLVRRGRVVWAASHFRVTADEITLAIARETSHRDEPAR